MERQEHGWWEFLKVLPMHLSFSLFASLGLLDKATAFTEINTIPAFLKQEKRSKSFLLGPLSIFIFLPT